MNFQSVYLLLPCHSLEDFPVHHRGENANGLLENWIAAWHPQLIASAGALPQWHQADTTPEDISNALVLVPSISLDSLSETLESDCQKANACLIQSKSKREIIVEEALGQIKAEPDCEPDRVSDFYSLGYGFLQVQLMTRQLRYSSNLDLQRFSELVIEAASAIRGPLDPFRAKIQACFDLLLEEKSRYYPVEANLIDLTLVAETTLGKSFQGQLNRDFQQNFLLTGEICGKLAANRPENFQLFCEAIHSGKAQIVGGNQTELPDPLISVNSMIRNLRNGAASLAKVCDQKATVYCRRSTGLTPILPEVLDRMQFKGALHSTLDKGRFPKGLAANIRWEGPTGDSIVALSKTPSDASEAATFLDLGIKIGEAIDSEHYSTVVFAHWPNKFHPVFEDLLRLHRYGPLLGNFVSFEQHFDSVYDPGYGETHSATEYRNSYLQQAIALKDLHPISRYVQYWDRTWKLRSLNGLRLLAEMYEKASKIDSENLADQVDSQINGEITTKLDQDIDNAIESCLNHISEPGPSTTVVNTLNYSRKGSVLSPGNAPPCMQIERIYLRDRDDGSNYWIIDCPPLGHTDLNSDLKTRKAKLGPPVVEDGRLQNEFFQLTIDEVTGGLRGLKTYNRRSNLLTQRLAARTFAGHPKLDSPTYGSMVAKKIAFHPITRLAGKATSSGDLILNDEKIAEFQQTVSIQRGSRIIEFEVELDVLKTLESTNGWDNYLCSRIAWAEENAEIRRELHHTTYKTKEKKICAPQLIEIDDRETKLSFLTGGLPYHQRSGERQLDTILICGKEQARNFRYAIAVNEKYSQRALAAWSTPLHVLPQSRISEQPSGWLFHFSSKNILMTLVEPLYDSTEKSNGVKFRLQETEGRRGDLTIHCPKKVSAAFLCDLSGNPIESLKFEDSQVKMDFLGSQMFDIQIYW